MSYSKSGCYLVGLDSRVLVMYSRKREHIVYAIVKRWEYFYGMLHLEDKRGVPGKVGSTYCSQHDKGYAYPAIITRPPKGVTGPRTLRFEFKTNAKIELENKSPPTMIAGPANR